MVYFVTGAAGFIGRKCVKLLDDQGHQVIATDVAVDKIPAGERVKAIACDLKKEQDLVDLLRKYRPENIIHLATLMVSESERDPFTAFKVSTGSGAVILEEVRKTNAKVVIASSIAVYGPQARYGLEHSANETDIPYPTTMYGASKLACEHLAAAYVRNFKLRVVCLRLPIVFGHGRGTGISAWASNVVSYPSTGKKFTVPFAAAQRTALTYVDLAVEFFLKLAQLPQAPQQIAYNAPGWSLSMADLVNKSETMIGVKGLMEYGQGGLMPFVTEWDGGAYAREFGYELPAIETCIAAHIKESRQV